MKKIIVLFATVLAMNTSNVFAANDETVITTTTTNTTQSESDFYTCQFSLNHYRGEILNGGKTSPIKVKLNCPQEKDVSATVFVYIDGNRVASDIFTVKAGETESSASNHAITVRHIYIGKDYVLDLK